MIGVQEAKSRLEDYGIFDADVISTDNPRVTGPPQLAMYYQKDGVKHSFPWIKNFVNPTVDILQLKEPENRQCLSCGASQAIYKLNRKICSYCGNDY